MRFGPSRRSQGPLCACGRLVDSAGITSYASGDRRWIFYRCECGREWTEGLDGIDRTQPVSGDELLSVHEALAGWDGSLLELLEGRP